MSLVINNKTERNFLKEFKNATIVFVAICSVFVVIRFFLARSFNTLFFKETLITNSLFTYSFYFANLYLVDFLDKKMPWHPKPIRRALYGTLITIVINLIVVYIVITLVTIFAYDGPANYVFSKDGKFNVLITFVIVTFVSLLFYSVGFFNEMQKEKLVSETLRKEKISAELNALKSQVNPHFLFNSFNVLSGLIDENPQQAQKFLSGLSKIYRYVLENRNENFITLKKELEFAEQYLDLQKVRFEDGIDVRIKVPESDLEKSIPALTLQLLLENAITHNGFDSKSPLFISIESQNNMLKVSNNKQIRNKLTEGNGMGLKNIQDRYKLQNVTGFKIEDIEDSFIVNLPLIS